MRRRRAALAAALGLAVLAVALAGPRLLGSAAEPAGPALPADQAIVARAVLLPTVHLFGDDVTARLQVAVDRRKLDPGAVTVELAFEPYEQVGEPRVERRDEGHVAHLIHTVTLRCLALACVPPVEEGAAPEDRGRGERHVFELPPARVVFGGSAEREPLAVRWPPLESVSRINRTEYQAWAGTQSPYLSAGQRAPFPFKASLVPAEPTFRVPPSAVAGGALAGALLLLLFVPGRLAYGWVRGRRLTPAERWALLPPRERARLVASWAAGRPDLAERRRALELAASELGREGDESLERLARELAWSGGEPGPEATSALADEIGRNGGA